MKVVTSLLFLLMFLICIVAVVQYGDEDNHKRNVPIAMIKKENNTINFKVKHSHKEYQIDLPSSIKINDGDEITISFETHKNKIYELEEIFINKQLVWDMRSQNPIKVIITN